MVSYLTYRCRLRVSCTTSQYRLQVCCLVWHVPFSKTGCNSVVSVAIISYSTSWYRFHLSCNSYLPTQAAAFLLRVAYAISQNSLQFCCIVYHNQLFHIPEQASCIMRYLLIQAAGLVFRVACIIFQNRLRLCCFVRDDQLSHFQMQTSCIMHYLPKQATALLFHVTCVISLKKQKTKQASALLNRVQ